MIVTQFELDSFHHFASEKLEAAGAEFTWDELFVLWDSTKHRASANAGIREGLADVQAGRYQPAAEAMEEIREEFGFPN